MYISLVKSKIHRAVVTGADVNYEGSLAISADLAESVEEFDKSLLAAHIGEIEQKIEKTEEGSRLDQLIARLDHFKDVDRHLTGTGMH